MRWNKLLLFHKLIIIKFILFPQVLKSQNLNSFEIYLGDTINKIDKNGLKQGKWIFFGKNKLYDYYSNFSRDQKVEEIFFVNDHKNGPWKVYHKNNKVYLDAQYLNDELNGKLSTFDEQGNIKETGIWEKDQFVSALIKYENNKETVNIQDLKKPYDKHALLVSGSITDQEKIIKDCIIKVYRNDIPVYSLRTDDKGQFKLQLDLQNDYLIKFFKEGYTSSLLEIDTRTPDKKDLNIYTVSDWKVQLFEKTNFIGKAGTDIYNVLLNKPVGRIFYNKKKKEFGYDHAYAGLFKKEFKNISEGTKLLLAKAAEDNERLALENAQQEAQLKAKEIALLKADKELKDVEISKREAEILKQKLESEKKARDLELLARERKINQLKYEQQKALLEKQQFEAERKAREIEKLSQQKKIQELELNQKELAIFKKNQELNKEKEAAILKEKEINLLNKEKEVREEQMRADARFRMVLIFGLLIVVAFAVYMVWSFRQKHKANRLLARQKEQIEQKNEELNQQNEEIAAQRDEIENKSLLLSQKNKDITDSINYAKRLQNAILPSVDLIKKHLPESFILFKPKDIVSGDFYYFTEISRSEGRGTSSLEHIRSNDDTLLIFALADCTGHGVPGGFMSMVGNSLLHQIINEKKIFKPSEILDRLHDGIALALKQEETEVRDGMEIALMLIDKANRKMEFASANRALWIIDRRTNELKEIKPDKFPIGGLHSEDKRRYTNQVIDISPDSLFYCSSDGYADQFGGEKGKKIMSKKFKQLINQNSTVSFEKQKDQLNVFFEKWKAGYEQVDDVLVVGFRV